MLAMKEIAERVARPAAHELVRRDAKALGLNDAATEALLIEYDKDPIGYANARYGDLG